jgi:hypothetical protein
MSAGRAALPLVAAVALFFAWPGIARGQTAEPALSGEVMDASGGRLPGVAITATSTAGETLGTTVTDDAGSYAFAELPAGTVSLRFEIDGFAAATEDLVILPGSASKFVQRLEVAPFAENVDVRGRSPRVAPLPDLPPVRRAPIVDPLPVYDRDTICGPAKPRMQPDSLGVVAGGREANAMGLYAEGAELVIDGGASSGLDIGRNLIVRRYERIVGEKGAGATREHSAGLVQIVEADESTSIAVVVFACDEARSGDFLASFVPASGRDVDPPGMPDYSDAARILFADEGQRLGAPRRLMVIDRGTERGTYVGQRFTLFRQFRGLGTREAVGDAVAVAVRSDSATIRIERVVDAIAAGDWAAPEIPLAR